MPDKYDVTEPILVIARRAKRGSGFLISPFDDPANVAPCASAAEIGEAVMEMIEDEKQPRCDMSQFSPLNQEAEKESEKIEEEEEEEEDVEEEDGEWDEGPELDLADQFILGAFNKLLSGAQSVSTGGHKRRRKKKGKK